MLELSLPCEVRLEQRDRGAVAVNRGPLLFALRVGEDWRRIGGEEPFADWEVHPTTPWNYALATARPLTLERRAVSSVPFDGQAPPLLLRGEGRRVPGWGLVDNSAGPVPAEPGRERDAARADRAGAVRERAPARSRAADDGLRSRGPGRRPGRGPQPGAAGQRRGDAPGRLDRVDDRGQRAGPARQAAGPERSAPAGRGASARSAVESDDHSSSSATSGGQLGARPADPGLERRLGFGVAQAGGRARVGVDPVERPGLQRREGVVLELAAQSLVLDDPTGRALAPRAEAGLLAARWPVVPPAAHLRAGGFLAVSTTRSTSARNASASFGSSTIRRFSSLSVSALLEKLNEPKITVRPSRTMTLWCMT